MTISTLALMAITSDSSAPSHIVGRLARLMNEGGRIRHRTGLPRYDGIWVGSTFTRKETAAKVAFMKPVLGFREGYIYNNMMFASAGSVMDTLTVLTPNWYAAELHDANLAFVNKTGITQFRLSFNKDDNNNLNADTIAFYSGDSVSANTPQLIVTYYIP